MRPGAVVISINTPGLSFLADGWTISVPQLQPAIKNLPSS